MDELEPMPANALREVMRLRGWRAAPRDGESVSLPPWELDTALALAAELAGLEVGERHEELREALYREGRRRLFPERFPAPGAELGRLAEFFFPLAAAVLEERRRRGGERIADRLPFTALAPEEIAAWPSADEYRTVLAAIDEDGLLPLLFMAQEWIGFSIADHVLGVTGLALWIGRQLARSVAVDLPLLHGAAIGHDVGKFGCIGEEERRIPRLHYYYTHEWYASRGLPGLGHIATNHSTWDLERVRLPIETQLLIYADFRVKDAPGPDGATRMSVISLRDAFGTIRDKLEDLDRAKLARYRKVYRKLRDLEGYLVHLGVELDPPGLAASAARTPELPHGLRIVEVMAGRQRPDAVALATGRGVVATARLFAAAHNIGVMERLRDVPALRELLEEARSYEGWRDLRTYIGVIGEYAAALSMEQRELALDFFYDLLDHREDDVRYHAGNRIGDLLALGEEAWRKDLPEGIVPERGSWVLAQVERVLALLDLAGPETEDDDARVEQVVYAVPVILRRLVRNADEELRPVCLQVIFDHCTGRVHDRRPLVGLHVCETFEVLLPYFTLEQRLELAEVALAWAFHESESTRLMAWRLLVALARAGRREPELLPGVRYCVELLGRRLSRDMLVAELHLLAELAEAVGMNSLKERCRGLRDDGRFPLREVLLRNLKARVGWVEKKVNCDYLLASALERVQRGDDPGSHFAAEVAAHLANVLKVSRVEGARFHAGRCLVELHEVLTVPQRNDLMVELMRSLQLDVEAVTRYIPRFLGAIIAALPEQEFNEALDDIELNTRRGNEPLQRLLLQTVGWIIVSLEDERVDGPALRRLAGILLGSLVETRTSTVHEGYAQVAMVLDRLTRKKRSRTPLARFLAVSTKSLLSLVSHLPDDRGRFFLIASALNHLDRAIEHAGRRLRLPRRPSVAFLPGTFDPFTRAHSAVVARVLEQVDEVLVQVDDYSWRKHTQPRQVRNELAAMALASMPEAFEAPFDPPVNLANQDSVRHLVRRLGGRELWFVVGSDVLVGASAYRDDDAAIWDIPHLVVVREGGPSHAWQAKLARFRDRVQVVSVPPAATAISSTTLRSALDEGADLAPLCDPLVARTLEERRLYVNYPSTKRVVRPPRYALEVRKGREEDPAGLEVVARIESLPAAARWSGRRRELCVLVGRDTGSPQAALAWREVTAAALPVELADSELAALPELGIAGSGALVASFAHGEGARDETPWVTLMSQVMARWLDAGLLFALVALPDSDDHPLVRALHGCGATWLSGAASGGPGGLRWATLRLIDPMVLVWDLEQVLQPPFAGEPAVQRAIIEAREAIGGYFCRHAPGTAVLHFFERETKRAVAEWARQRIADSGSHRRWVVLGLGSQFYRDLIGDCPTLAIDLERFLSRQGYEGGMRSASGSPSLELQLHTARELGREALLLVPFLGSDEPVLRVRDAARAAGITLRDVLVGVTNASVHAALHLRGVPHRCGAVIPRWSGVLRESALMPYIGGWSILGREPLRSGSLRPSLNDCLPYHHPHPVLPNGVSALDFSRVALDHTRRLLLALEEVFRAREGRLLSLFDLAAVVRTPRCPPLPRGFEPRRERVPSELLEEDVEALARLHPEPHTAHRGGWGAE